MHSHGRLSLTGSGLQVTAEAVVEEMGDGVVDEVVNGAEAGLDVDMVGLDGGWWLDDEWYPKKGKKSLLGLVMAQSGIGGG